MREQSRSQRRITMSLFSWLLERMTGRPQCGRTPAPRTARRFRPQLEVLEGRDVPSTLTVTNNLDFTIYGEPPGSLRYEIEMAAPRDTIVFDPSPNGTTI